MSEFILASIGTLITYAYMLAVIAFVALQFGWIKKPDVLPTVNSQGPSGTQAESGNAVGGVDFAGLMKGVLSNLGPALQQMQAPGVPSGETAQVQEVPQLGEKPAVHFNAE